MTSRTRHYIDLDDLLGLHFGCKQCDTSVDISTGLVTQLPLNCPNCGLPWMTAARGDMPGSPIHALLFKFVAELTMMKKALADSQPNPPNFSLTLEIAATPPAKFA